jgi:rubredoxin
VSNDEKYKCIVCGYVYDPATGDPVGQIAKNTPFDTLPEHWRCPGCGADKTAFEPLY